MIKVEVLEDFTLKDFGELKNIERGTTKNEEGKLFKYDKFKCSKDMCEYLTGKNPLNRPVVKVIEIIPEKIEDAKIEENASNKKQDANVQVTKPKTTNNKNTKKSSKK